MVAGMDVSDLELLERSGVDAVLYLSLQRTFVRLIFAISCLSLIVVMPVNMSGGQNRVSAIASNTTYNTGFTDWTIQNIPSKPIPSTHSFRSVACSNLVHPS